MSSIENNFVANIGVGSPQSAREIAASIRNGEQSAVQVVTKHLATLEQFEPTLHAYNSVLGELAIKRAHEIDQQRSSGAKMGPLAGVPIALKDNLCTNGIATTCSSKILKGWLPPYDATVVSKLTEAGAIIVGKTNMDEFAMGSSTENSCNGPSRNPHDTNKVPGGSSGGSAVAVASGSAALALGSDTGGSIRQPASLCGVVGLKPTYGAVSRYGLIAYASSLDQVGPFAHTVADAALAFSVIVGHDERDSTSIPSAALEPISGTRALEAVDHAYGNGIAGLRVGIISELAGAAIAPDVLERLHAGLKFLSDAGAKVDEVSIPVLGNSLSAYYLIATAEASSNLARYDGVRYGQRVNADNLVEMMSQTRASGFGDEVKRRIMLGTYALSAGYYDAYYGQAQKVRTLVIDGFAKAYQDFDVLISPTSPTTAFGIGEKVSDPLTMYATDVCTIPSNLAGHPAISVPCGLGIDSMPVGVQILGPALSECKLFSAAAIIEKGMSNVG